jgi:hypothetical protein
MEGADRWILIRCFLCGYPVLCAGEWVTCTGVAPGFATCTASYRAPVDKNGLINVHYRGVEKK